MDVGFFYEDGADAVAENLHVGLREMLASHELYNPFVWVI